MSNETFPTRYIACPMDLMEHLGEHLHDVDPAQDNTVRAGFAATGVKAFAQRVGTYHHEDMETNLSDFLCDLMHLCDALGISFEDMVSRGAFHYDAELRGE